MLAAAPGVVALAQPGGFGDVAGDTYYSEPVAALTAMGVFEGTECDAGFCPGEAIDRKTMAVWTVRVLTGQDPPTVSQTRFSDVDAESFYAPFVERMAQLGITAGCGDGTRYCPDRSVTRAQMAVFLSRAYSLADGPDPGFTDVPAGAWYAADVARLAASGITAGCGDGTVFCPGRDTTRAQMATFLWRAENRRPDSATPVQVPTDGSVVSVPAGGSFTAEFDTVTVSAPAGALTAATQVTLSETSVGASDITEGEELAATPIALGITGARIARPLEFRVELDTSDLSATGVTPAWFSGELQAWVPLVTQDLVIGDGEVTFKATLADARAVIAATAFGPTLSAAGGFGATPPPHFAAHAFVAPLIVVGILVFVGVAAAVTVVALNNDVIHDALKEFFELVADEPACSGPLPAWATFVTDSDEGLPPGRARLHTCGQNADGALSVKVVNNRNYGTEVQGPASGRAVSLPGGTNPTGALDIAIKEVAEEVIGGSYLWPLSQSAFVLPAQTSDWTGYLRPTGQTAVVDGIRIGLDLLKIALPQIEQANNLQFVTCVRALLDQVGRRSFHITSREDWASILGTVASCFNVDDSRLDNRTKAALGNVKTALSWTSTINSAAKWGLTIADNIKDTRKPDATIRVGTAPLKADLSAFNPAIEGGGILAHNPYESRPGACMLREGGTIVCLTYDRAIQIFAPERFSSVTHGECQIKTNGAIACGSEYRIRYQSDDPSNEPSDQSARYIALQTTTAMTCGLRTNRSIVCWGRDADRWYGPVPALSGALYQLSGPFTALSVTWGARGKDYSSASSACAIRADGTLTCWETSTDDDDSYTIDEWPNSPGWEVPPGQFVAVSLGGPLACAIRTDGTLTCWGDNEYGQLDVPPGKFTTVSSGGGSACAIRTDGTIACWGRNDFGQLDVPPGKFITVSSQQGRLVCAVRTDGTVTCWGFAGGVNGSTSMYSDFGTLLSGRFSALSEYARSCAIRTDGTIACWGRYLEGQWNAPSGQFSALFGGACGLRIDGTIACWGRYLEGQWNAPSGQFSAVSGVYYHTCGLRADGTLTCWGDNEYGQLDAPSGQFSAVSAGFQHTCGLRADGTITCWGSNNYGKSEPPSGQFSAVAAGFLHTCGLRADGTIACWGLNATAQLDAPSGQFSAVAAGSYHTCGLRADGTIACWGLNATAQLDAPSGQFSAVAAGSYHTCGLRADGTIACWGGNYRRLPG